MAIALLPCSDHNLYHQVYSLFHKPLWERSILYDKDGVVLFLHFTYRAFIHMGCPERHHLTLKKDVANHYLALKKVMANVKGI